MIAEVVANNIREIRIAKGLTQTELGKIIGKEYHSVNRWERAKAEPSFSNIESIAQALGVDPLLLMQKKAVERVSIPRMWLDRFMRVYRGMAVMNPQAEEVPEELLKLTENQPTDLLTSSYVIQDTCVNSSGAVTYQSESYSPDAYSLGLNLLTSC